MGQLKTKKRQTPNPTAAVALHAMHPLVGEVIGLILGPNSDQAKDVKSCNARCAMLIVWKGGNALAKN